MKQFLAFCALILVLVACNKDKVETRPHVKFKSFSSDVITQSGTLRVNLEFTDQEGDLDSLYVIRQRLNKKGVTYLRFEYSGFPEFGNQTRGEVAVNFDVQNNLVFNLNPIGSTGNYEPDTLQLGFYIKDKEGNFSDTARATPLIVLRQ